MKEQHALQAALAGQGLVADSVRRGELVAFRPEVHLAGAVYAVVCAPGRERQANVHAFNYWLNQWLSSDPTALLNGR